MTAPPFDGSTYRRTVLTPLRTVSPAGVVDVFWLGDVPRDADDPAQIAARLKAAKAFLHKERSRPRQADVAAAVLREWPRVEGVLADSAARGALRARLGDAAPGAEVATLGGVAGAPTGAGTPSGGLDPAARRRRQVASALGELARLREEPELAEDLFAFLGLPVTATGPMLRARVEKVSEVNRKRRPDRERSLVDELLMHSRELLVDGDPAAYRAALAAAVEGPATDAGAPGVDYTRRRAPAADPPTTPLESAAPPTVPSSPPVDDAPTVQTLVATREPSGAVRLTWTWPVGVTEAFVVVGEPVDPGSAPAPSRKFTNTKYGLDGGAVLDPVAPGTTLTVLSGRRDASGQLAWSSLAHAPATIAP